MKDRRTAILVFLAVEAAAALSCYGGGDEIAVFDQANGRYSEGMALAKDQRHQESLAKFAEASRLYEEILASGFISWPVLYNLGNAEYRQGRLGRAILNYRRAERLAPRNADIKANLKQAKAQTRNSEASSELPSFFRSLLFCYYALTLNEAAILSAALYFAFCGFEILYIFFRSSVLKRATILLLALTIVSAGSLLLKVRNEQHTRSGVVTARECPVRAGPGEEFNTLVTVHEGADVIVREERTDAREGKLWLRVKVLIEAEQRTESETKRVFGPEGYVQSSDVELL
jgi:hypothetical protein